MPWVWVNIGSGNGLFTCWHQAITSINVDLSSIRSNNINLTAISQWIPQPSITEHSLKITYVKFHSKLIGASELRVIRDLSYYYRSFLFDMYYCLFAMISKSYPFPAPTGESCLQFSWRQGDVSTNCPANYWPDCLACNYMCAKQVWKWVINL